MCAPHLRPISFNFMHFLPENRMCAPHLRQNSAPPFGKSWIRHWSPKRWQTAVADLSRRPPGVQILSISFGKIVCWRPPSRGVGGPLLGEILDPPLNSLVFYPWIMCILTLRVTEAFFAYITSNYRPFGYPIIYTDTIHITTLFIDTTNNA